MWNALGVIELTKKINKIKYQKYELEKHRYEITFTDDNFIRTDGMYSDIESIINIPNIQFIPIRYSNYIKYINKNLIRSLNVIK